MKDVWGPLKEALIGIVTSKKFIAGISATVAALVAKYGFDVDASTIALVLSPVIAAIVGQGIADTGKEAAKVHRDAVK